jgi:hypothetical protein
MNGPAICKSLDQDESLHGDRDLSTVSSFPNSAPYGLLYRSHGLAYYGPSSVVGNDRYLRTGDGPEST